MRYKVRLEETIDIAEGTKVFIFNKPQGFSFLPGQYVDVTLLSKGENDAKGMLRSFSISSAPHEDFIAVATRMRESAFKRELGRMKVGEEAIMDGPFGSFVLHSDIKRPAVFIGGGMGVVPAVSMLRQLEHEKNNFEFKLFYVNRKKESAVFFDELRRYENSSRLSLFVPTLSGSEAEVKGWWGERGRITVELITKYLSDFSTPYFYCAGSPIMVAAAWRILTELGVPSENIKTDEFDGY